MFAGVHGQQYGFYRFLSNRFPFAIYYDICGYFVRIAAILDMRKDPAWIRNELQERSNKND